MQVIGKNLLVHIFVVCLIGLFFINRINAQQGGFQEPNVNNPITRMILQPDGKILIGGIFSTVNGQPRNFLARLNNNGTLDGTFQDPIINGVSVNAIALQPDGKILVGGDFRFAGGQERNNLARFNADGSLDAGFNPSVNNDVLAILPQPDGKILIGGEFTIVGGETRSKIARLNPNGTLDSTFQNVNISHTNAGAITFVTKIELQSDGRIIIGGYFNLVNGQARTVVARLNLDGSLDTSFQNPNIGDSTFTSAYALALQPDGKLLVGGYFSTVAGQPRQGVIRLNADGTLDTSFQDPNFTSIGSTSVNGLVLQPDGRILIWGAFNSVGGQTRKQVARLNQNGSLDTSFRDPDVSDGSVNALVLQTDGRILIAGYYTSVGGRSRRNITRLAANGSLDVLLPTTFTVTKTADTNDGVCDTDCSLREAIIAANFSDSDDTIQFDPGVFSSAQTITLTNGQLGVCNNGSLVINGTNANRLIISGNNQSRVFRIFGGTAATFNNLTISNGKAEPGDFSGCPAVLGSDFSVGGGAIENRGTLSINNSIISNNSGGTGGGLANVHGTATITNSIINNNQASSGYGGIANIGTDIPNVGIMTLVNSQVSNNKAPFELGNGGGGIGNSSRATLNLINSTVNNNATNSQGGGIRNLRATLTVRNSTISGNNAKNGGGIYNDSIVNLLNATIAFNQANTGGGICFENTFTPNTGTNSRNTIISNNTANSAPDIFERLNSQGYNLIGNSSGASITGDITGNLLNVDPFLDPVLRSSGTSTLTHALLANSPAVDKGAAAAGITTDQRGLPRPIDFQEISNASGGDGSDIGAFEVQPTQSSASVSISGRVINRAGRGISNVRVTMTNSIGETRIAATNPFGYYRFLNTPAGDTYTIGIAAKKYTFSQSSQMLLPVADIDGVNFIADN